MEFNRKILFSTQYTHNDTLKWCDSNFIRYNLSLLIGFAYFTIHWTFNRNSVGEIRFYCNIFAHVIRSFSMDEVFSLLFIFCFDCKWQSIACNQNIFCFFFISSSLFWSSRLNTKSIEKMATIPKLMVIIEQHGKRFWDNIFSGIQHLWI